jgi:hypothetical protein
LQGNINLFPEQVPIIEDYIVPLEMSNEALWRTISLPNAIELSILHTLIKHHLAGFVRNIGPLRLCWCCKPENMNYIAKQMYVNTNNRAVYKNMLERFLMLKLLDDFFSRTTLPVDQLLHASPPNARLSIFGVLKLNDYFSSLATHIDRIGKITGFLQGGRISARMY